MRATDAAESGFTAGPPPGPPEGSPDGPPDGPPPGPPEGVGWQIDPRYLSSGLITLILVFGQLYVGFLHDLSQLFTAIAAALAAELTLGRLLTGKWLNPASAYITGISCGILLRSLSLWPYAIASLLSILSKYVLRFRGRHLWNPSNLGICVVLFAAPGTVAALGEQWGNDLWAMAVIWVLGSVILWRAKRFHVTFTYAVSFVALAYVRSMITGTPFLSEVAPITGPMYQLMAFFMVTDPATSVSSRNGRIGVAFLVALAEMVLRLYEIVNAPLYALFLAGPAAKVLDLRRSA
ncbi:MAG: RnfABCDGE type electron transport complex subunit D [Gemmatimonadota bacterium]|nr:RnfABCDGE type electron transport complex subunit D [Gemmatimonadota bacterium]